MVAVNAAIRLERLAFLARRRAADKKAPRSRYGSAAVAAAAALCGQLISCYLAIGRDRVVS